MGSSISRCNSKSNGHGTGPGISEVGQKIFERQPNWLTPPSKWRSHHCSHQPVRYRTPTPYPKDDRKRCNDVVVLNEKNMIIETPVVDHIEVQKPSQKRPPMVHSHRGHRLPSTPLTITWESHPRLNRFERAS